MAKKFTNRKYNIYGWFVFLTLIVIEYVIFRAYVLREVAPYYPTGYDQSAYLSSAYWQYELLKKQGVIVWLRQSLIQSSATGILMPIQSVLFFLFFGASRLSALSINFIFFAAMQTFLVLSLRSLRLRWRWVAIAIGLVLSLNTLFFEVGDLVDFRIDFLALCLFGIFISLFLMSDIFLKRRWSIFSGLIAGYLVLLRYFTAVYFTAIYLTFVLFLGFKYLRNNRNEEILHRFKNTVISLALIILIAAPFLIINRTAIYDYYFVGHVFGSEKQIRAIEQGVSDVTGHLLFYPISAIKHLGLITIFLIGAIFLYVFIFRIFNEKSKTASSTLFPTSIALVFIMLTIAVPLFILATDVSKSPIVANVVMIPVILGVIIIAWRISDFKLKSLAKNSEVIFSLLAIAVLSTGIVHYTINFTRHGPNYDRRYEIAQIERMYLDMGQYAERSKIKSANIFFTSQTFDAFGATVFMSVYYEEKHYFIQANNLGYKGTDKVTLNDLKASMSKSDFVVIDTMNKNKVLFPLEKTIARNIIPIRIYTEKKFKKFGTYNAFGRKIDVYVKQEKSSMLRQQLDG